MENIKKFNKTIRVEHRIPTSGPWGAPFTDVESAVADIKKDYWKLTGNSAGAPIPSDLIRTVSQDGHVLIFFVLEDRSRE